MFFDNIKCKFYLLSFKHVFIVCCELITFKVQNLYISCCEHMYYLKFNTYAFHVVNISCTQSLPLMHSMF